jgi:ribonuclease P protein component
VTFISVFRSKDEGMRKGILELQKTVSLNQNHDFRRLYRKKGAVAAPLVTYVAKNRLGFNRIGITTSKKIGKAHDRNRARRIIREAYRLLLPRFSQDTGFDIVFVARTRTTNCTMQEVYKVMKKQLAPYLISDDEAHN